MRIIVAVTGATGVQMSGTLLRALRQQENCEIHLIVSEGAKLTWRLECEQELITLYDLADYVYEEHDLAAVIASGSFVTDGMIIIPCSMKTLAGIVSGYAENLVQRAADVCLKEGRKVVLVPREMPLGKVHLKNLKKAAGLGCAIVPPMLTFYNGAQTLQEQVDHVVGKVLLQFHIEYKRFVPWTGERIVQNGRENIDREPLTDFEQNMSQTDNEHQYDAVNRSMIDGRSEKKLSVNEKQTDTVSIKPDIAENTSRQKERKIETDPIKTSIYISVKLSFSSLSFQAQQIGEDLQILLWGGSTPHIGSVVLTTPRPSLMGDGKMSSTSSVINRSGHKDEQLCRAVAEQVTAATGRAVVCSGGFHVEGIEKSQIQEVQEAVQRATQELIEKLLLQY